MEGCTWKGVQNSRRSRDFGLSGQTYTKINSKTLTNEIHLSIPYQSFQFLNQKQTPNTPSEFLSTYFTDISFQAPPFRHIGFEISIYPFDTDLPGHLFREIVHHGQSMHLSILDYFIWNIILFFIIQNCIFLYRNFRFWSRNIDFVLKFRSWSRVHGQIMRKNSWSKCYLKRVINLSEYKAE